MAQSMLRRVIRLIFDSTTPLFTDIRAVISTVRVYLIVKPARAKAPGWRSNVST